MEPLAVLNQVLLVGVLLLLVAHPWIVARLALSRMRSRERRVQYLGDVVEPGESDLLVGPVTGWKRTQVVFSPDASSVTLQGLAHAPTFGLEADAVCAFDCGHVLSLSCTCGFYAYKSMVAALEHPQGPDRDPLVKVMISGDFVEYGAGWRYSHQRIEHMQFTTSCFWCDRFAVVLVGAPGMSPLGLCRKHVVSFVKNPRSKAPLVTFAELRGMLQQQVTPGREFTLSHEENSVLSPADVRDLVERYRPQNAPSVLPGGVTS